MMIQQVVGGAEMGEINRMIEGDNREVPMHAPGDLHANDKSSPMVGEAKPGTNIEAAIEYPRE
jgi:hypothetical protein